MRDAPTYCPWLNLQAMVGFLQRCGYSPRWRLLWHVTHIEARRASCITSFVGGVGWGRNIRWGSPLWYDTIYLGYMDIFVIWSYPWLL